MSEKAEKTKSISPPGWVGFSQTNPSTMTAEENHPKVSEESMATTRTTKQRRKRKWDQPAESFISSGLEISGALPVSDIQSLAGLAVPGMVLPKITLTNPASATSGTISPAIQASSVQQTMATMLQKVNPPKIQDELIAREIVINDAEPTVRYKLTKRQTQEEIQRCTGAVVITRGKYRPPNALRDSDKPLYLHISAGSHLKETAERIIAVDHAAAMVEEMLNQGQNPNLASTPLYSAINNGGQASQPLSVPVFLGFDTDPSLNVASRIRGPNDQYINHIMNETGVTVVLRGQGSGNFEGITTEDIQQPLHLFLSGSNPKKLEDAKLLAENLLDTIAAECGASRVSSSKVYKAVPPPPQLLAGVQSLGTAQRVTSDPVVSVASPIVGSMPAQISSAALPNSFSQTTLSQHESVLGSCHTQPNTIYYPQTSVCGTSYNGYGGIYPQATPLQQVALVLRQTPSPGTSLSTSAMFAENTSTNGMSSSTAVEKRPPQKRKFQELPKTSKTSAEPHQNSLQRSEFVKTGPSFNDSCVRTTSSMPPPKMLVKPSSNGMPPPPPRSMPPPPLRTMPPPSSKPSSSTLPSESDLGSSKPKSPSGPVPDTLIKLMEYGDDDDDDEDDNGLNDISEESNLKPMKAPKPFWAL